MIRKLLKKDWEDVRRIYVEGIRTKKATFEQEENLTSFDHWYQSKIPTSCMVLEQKKIICGWSALSQVSSRRVYAGVAEVSVYVSPLHKGMGCGKKLLQALIDYAEDNNIWTLQASIFIGNEASLSLHNKLGFRKVGYREKIAKLDGAWQDTVLMERRSKIII